MVECVLLCCRHVDYHAFDSEGLIADMKDLAAADVVLMVNPLRVPPIQVFNGRAIGAIILQNFGGVIVFSTERKRHTVMVELSLPGSACWRQTSRVHLRTTFHHLVNSHR